jgi:hypothetical protein
VGLPRRSTLVKNYFLFRRKKYAWIKIIASNFPHNGLQAAKFTHPVGWEWLPAQGLDSSLKFAINTISSNSILPQNEEI